MFFREERGRERERQRAYWAALGTHLRHSPGQRRGKDRRLWRKKPSIKSDKSKSASSTAALGKRAGRSRQRRGWTAERKEMDISGLSISEQCFDEWLPSYHSSIIRQLNTCCLQMLEKKIKLSHNDLRVHIFLLLYSQSFARLDRFCVQFFFPLNEAICF